MRRWLALAACAGTLLLPGRPGPPAVRAAAGLEAIVRDDAGQPLADAVVSVTTAGEPTRARATTAVMDQHDKTFVPLVLPVPVGTSVAFPNRDNIRHHVYSFSPAKRFELPLYIGTPAAPVVFDRPGVVVLGCNIHDWMVAYIYISATPYFAKTAADGRARLPDLPTGTHEARVWHPRMRLEPEKTARPVTLGAGPPGQVTFVVALKPERRAPPPRLHYDDAPQSRRQPGPGGASRSLAASGPWPPGR